MSGILAVFHPNGAPVRREDLARVAGPLRRRGPQGTRLWASGPVGLGHTLLATTPELVYEPQPFCHPPSGCTITADVRLDNRSDLLSSLGLRDRADNLGDAELIIMAYLAWGEDCLPRLLGDFAFVLWDPRQQRLLCARDAIGVRPLCYHHAPGRIIAVATEATAIVQLPEVPCAIDEGQMADAIVLASWPTDHTSTMFTHVQRLPPAHFLSAGPDHFRCARYWRLEPGPELRLPSDAAYAEAFLDVFTEAVRCRLRSPTPVASMLSGGMDSGSTVAVARELLQQSGQGPLVTYSGVAPAAVDCIETRAIHISACMPGLAPRLIAWDRLEDILPELETLTWEMEDPFDCFMTLNRIIYLHARREGISVVLDGWMGDTVLSTDIQIAHLLRGGRWLAAYQEAKALNAFLWKKPPITQQLRRAAKAAFVPGKLRKIYRDLRESLTSRNLEAALRGSPITREFAQRVDLGGRILTSQRNHDFSNQLSGALASCQEEAARVIMAPYVARGCEAYQNSAAAAGVERRDAFNDRRIVEFCAALPGHQKQGSGWYKIILRRAMAGRLPDPIRWGPNKYHLGRDFTSAVIQKLARRMTEEQQIARQRLSGYACIGSESDLIGDKTPPESRMREYGLVLLSQWIGRESSRCKSDDARRALDSNTTDREQQA